MKNVVTFATLAIAAQAAPLAAPDVPLQGEVGKYATYEDYPPPVGGYGSYGPYDSYDSYDFKARRSASPPKAQIYTRTNTKTPTIRPIDDFPGPEIPDLTLDNDQDEDEPLSIIDRSIHAEREILDGRSPDKTQDPAHEERRSVMKRVDQDVVSKVLLVLSAAFPSATILPAAVEDFINSIPLPIEGPGPSRIMSPATVGGPAKRQTGPHSKRDFLEKLRELAWLRDIEEQAPPGIQKRDNIITSCYRDCGDR